MLNILFLAAAVAVAPPYPPDWRPKPQVKHSPRHQEHLASLGVPMAHHSQLPMAVLKAPIQGFAITNITVGGSLTLEWQNGSPPFQVEGQSSLNGPWSTIGNPTILRAKTLPLDQNRFFRVQGNVPLLSITNTTLSWVAPEIAMSDSLTGFKVCDRQTDVPVGESPESLTGWNVRTTIAPGQPLTYDDTQPLPEHYKIVEVTANGVVVPYNVVSASQSAPGDAAWANRFGGASADLGNAVAADGGRNIIAIGTFQTLVNFGGGDLTGPSGYSAMFIAKFLPSGAHVWSKAFSGNNITVPTCVALDASGNSFVGGYFGGTANFGGADKTSHGGNDCFLAKYDAQGNHQWSISFGLGVWDQVSSVAVDSQGNVILTGFFGGAVGAMQVRGTDGAGTDLYSSSQSVFLAKFSPSGAYIFAKGLSSFGGDQGVAVAVDKRPNPGNNNLPYDNIVVAGNTSVQINFGGGNLGQGGWLVDLDPAGNYIRQRQVGTWTTLFGMTLDSGGGALVSGNFGGQTDLGGGPLTTAQGAITGFVVRYAIDDFSWKSQALIVGTENSTAAPKGMAADSQNNIYVTGYFVGTCNMGTKSMSSLYNECFLLKYATSGTTIAATPTWVDVFVMASDLNHLYYSYGNGVVVNNGIPVMVGYFNGNGVLGSAPLASGGDYDIFIASINP